MIMTFKLSFCSIFVIIIFLPNCVAFWSRHTYKPPTSCQKPDADHIHMAMGGKWYEVERSAGSPELTEIGPFRCPLMDISFLKHGYGK